MDLLYFISVLIPLAAVLAVALLRLRTQAEHNRLLSLHQLSESFRSAQDGSGSIGNEIDWQEGSQALSQMKDRFGRAGFLTPSSRTAAKRKISLTVVVIILASTSAGFLANGLTSAILGGIGGLYVSALGSLYWLRFKKSDFEREILFQSPLILESIILLVEAGMGILPALATTVSTREQTDPEEPTTILFRLIYQLSAHGIPFNQALEMVAEATESRVLRHVLLHLGISGHEGGELIPSLRSLSEHAHTEWRLSVEHRVRRLETSVVFPVFASVIGLMLLTAAVPLVPLLNLRDNLEKSSSLISQTGQLSAETLEQTTR